MILVYCSVADVTKKVDGNEETTTRKRNDNIELFILRKEKSDTWSQKEIPFSFSDLCNRIFNSVKENAINRCPFPMRSSLTPKFRCWLVTLQITNWLTLWKTPHISCPTVSYQYHESSRYCTSVVSHTVTGSGKCPLYYTCLYLNLI